MLKRLVRYLADVSRNRGTDNGYVECVLAKKSTVCAHLLHYVFFDKNETHYD